MVNVSPKVCSYGKVRGTIGWVIAAVIDIEGACHSPERGSNVVWWRHEEGNWMCWDARILVVCVVLVGWGGRVGGPTIACAITMQ